MRRSTLNAARFLSEDGSLELYFREIGKYRPLSRKQEAEVAAHIRDGDQDALEELVKANLRFVVSVARNYNNQGLALADLINEGNLGLIRAARRFDENKNFKFISYAVWWIRQAMLQALAGQSRIAKMPLNQVGMIYRIGKAQSRLAQKYARSPDMDEVAEELDASQNTIRAATRIGNRHTSLDAPLLYGRQGKLLDLVCDTHQQESDHSLRRLSLQKAASKALDTLNQREKDVIKCYFGIGETSTLTLDDIGQRLGLTRERVRQIKESALRRLKQCSCIHAFRAVLEE